MEVYSSFCWIKEQDAKNGTKQGEFFLREDAHLHYSCNSWTDSSMFLKIPRVDSK